jgi:hypothetical protein
VAPRRLWVVPNNDLEAKAICNLLTAAGEEVLVTGQAWGATWAGLEEPIQARLREAAPDTPIYGVELGGPNPFGAIDIDHHTYRDEDRWQPLSSLEQIAASLGTRLNEWQRLVAANDRGYFAAMRELGATDAQMEAVRQADRQAQGLTAEREAEAEAEVKCAERLPGGWLKLRVRKPSSAHSDRLFPEARAVLLQGDDEWLYSGPGQRELLAMEFPEKHWAGGSSGAGYFGIEQPGEATRAAILEWFTRAAETWGAGPDQTAAPASS